MLVFAALRDARLRPAAAKGLQVGDAFTVDIIIGGTSLATASGTDWNATTAKHVADYNGDGTVDATDARAIQSAIFA